MTTTTKPRIHYDCTKCPAFCCSIYERVVVNQRDINRLARHFELTIEEAERRFTKRNGDERILRRQKDTLLGQTCKFLNLETRGCSIYHARPQICREYPGRSRCGYYDILQFERETQEDDTVLPLIQLRFLKPKREA
ncbi:YkgJ family cysteine cluster protein [Chondromyces crocatus]|uniref:Fe-S oxidoreductase n=1 Tax=Chondromyces crocatus TaxID=52 RepID=A0A0K1EB40_CHOCO|nr:YkgJ family cysteine cluster protein [Chondromyces crocatus]AKT38059.1 uncharacterized protein CMC5_022000 [Chondromyces crocatus]